MSTLLKIMSLVNIPVALQVLGAVVFGLTIWKGVHGGWTTFGLIAGALMLYVGRHYGTLYNEFEKSMAAFKE